MKSKEYKLILLDLDDTLTRSSDAEVACFKYVLENFGVEYTDDMYKKFTEINIRLWGEYEAGKRTQPEILVSRFGELFKKFKIENISMEDFARQYIEALGARTKLIDNALNIVRELSQRGVVCIATNGVFSTQSKRLKNTGLDKHITHMFVSEDMKLRKPEKAFFDNAISSIPGATQENTIMVGDSLTSDIKGANNAGIDCVWYNPGGAKHDRAKYDINFEISDLAELLNIIA